MEVTDYRNEYLKKAGPKAKPAIATRLKDINTHCRMLVTTIERNCPDVTLRAESLRRVEEINLAASLAIMNEAGIEEEGGGFINSIDETPEDHGVDSATLLNDDPPTDNTIDLTTFTDAELVENLEAKGVNVEGMDREAMLTKLSEVMADDSTTTKEPGSEQANSSPESGEGQATA